MYEVSIFLEFSAAHQLRNYRGRCENLHGHNWKVEVSIHTKELDKIGMVIDFKKLKDKTRMVLDRLDHIYLNELPYFKKNNPTSENIARYIYDKLSQGLRFNGQGLRVKVWETDTSCASYYNEG